MPNACVFDRNSINGIPTTTAHKTGTITIKMGTYPIKLVTQKSTRYSAENTPTLIKSFTVNLLFIIIITPLISL